MTGDEVGIAWEKWRTDFLQSPLHLNQEELRRSNPKEFKKKGRSWHLVHVKQLICDTHVAKALIQHGVPTDYKSVIEIVDTVRFLKEEKRLAEEAEGRGGAAEPAETRRGASEEQKALRRAAMSERNELREGRNLYRRVQDGTLKLHKMDPRRQRLYDEFESYTLHRKVDAVNKEYGYGVARTNEYGTAEGEQMCQTESLTQRTAAILQLSVGLSLIPFIPLSF